MATRSMYLPYAVGTLADRQKRLPQDRQVGLDQIL
jgi:hypothetical protein